MAREILARNTGDPAMMMSPYIIYRPSTEPESGVIDEVFFTEECTWKTYVKATSKYPDLRAEIGLDPTLLGLALVEAENAHEALRRMGY